MENPKKANILYKGSLETAPACARVGTRAQVNLELAVNGAGSGNTEDAAVFLKGMQKFFMAKDNCDENFLFAYNHGTVAGMYIGAGLGKPTVSTALSALTERLRVDQFVGNQTVSQLCGSERSSERTFGVSIDATGNLAEVQKAVLEWSKGSCSDNQQLHSIAVLTGVTIMDIAEGNTTFRSNGTTLNPRFSRAGNIKQLLSPLEKRATCRYIEVVSGDGCASLASKCKISAADFTKFNPNTNLFSTLQAGSFVCCSTGDPYRKPLPPKPQPNTDGTCAVHLIANGDSCSKLVM